MQADFFLQNVDFTINAGTSPTSGSKVDSKLSLAAWNSNMLLLKRLVEQVQQGNNQLDFGPLHFAASLGNVDTMNQLLELGMDKNARDKDGRTPLMWVVSAEADEELMEALVDHGADVNMQNFTGETALFIAAQRGLEDKVDYLLENGANVHVKNLDGATALHAAAATGSEAIVVALVRYGSFLNAKDDEGDSPLHWAVREGHAELVSLLVRLGADVNCVNNDGETPLSLALSCEDLAMVKLLTGLGGSRLGGKLGGVSMSPVDDEGEIDEEELDEDVPTEMMDVEMSRAFGKLQFGQPGLMMKKPEGFQRTFNTTGVANNVTAVPVVF
jgi:ankyrin repeat protein